MIYFTKNFWKIIILTLVVGFSSGVIGAVAAWTLLLAYRTELVLDRTERPNLVVRRQSVIDEEKSRQVILERVLPILAEVWHQASGERDGIDYYLPRDVIGRGLTLTSDGWILAHRSELPRAAKTVKVGIGPALVSPTSILLDTETEAVFIKVQGENLKPAEFGNSEVVGGGQELYVVAGAEALHRVRVHRLVAEGRSSSDHLNITFSFDRELIGQVVGSPLVTGHGEVVGLVNSSRSAIPIHHLTGILKTILTSGELLRPSLGVSGVLLSGARLEDGGKERGFLVASGRAASERGLTRRGAAEAAGLREEDVVLKINETLVNGSQTLSELLLAWKTGDTVDLRIARGEEELVIPVKLGERNTGKEL